MHSPAAVVSRACQIPPASRDMSTPERASAMREKVVIIPRMVPSSPMSGASRAQHGQQGKPRFQPFQHRLPGEAQGGFTVRKGRAQERREVPQGGDGLQPGRQRPHGSPVRIASSTRPGKRESGNGHPMNTSARSTTIGQRRHRDGQQRPHHPAAQFDQPHKLLLYEDGASGREISVPMNTR